MKDKHQALNEFLRRRRTERENLLKMVLGKCPVCEGDVVTAGGNYFCHNHQKCGFIVRRDKLSKTGKPEIMPEEMIQLLKRDRIHLDLRYANGVNYSCGGRLFLHDRFGWGVQFCNLPKDQESCQGPTSSGPAPRMLVQRTREAQLAREKRKPVADKEFEQPPCNRIPSNLTLKRRQE